MHMRTETTSQTVALGEALYRLSKVVDYTRDNQKAYEEVFRKITLEQIARRVAMREEAKQTIPNTIGRRCQYGAR